MKKIFKEGHMARVYVDKEFAYKVYDDFYPEEWVDKEINIHNILREKTCLNVAKMTKINPHEIKMPYLSKDTLDVSINNQFDESKLIDFVHLQTQIFQYKSLELENAHIVYKRWIKMSQLSSEIKAIAIRILENIEYKNNLCHFDFQPSHVVKFNNKYYMLDWIHAKLANPILDIASTYIILRLQSYQLANKYLYKILEMTDINMKKIYQVIPLMAAIRMIETDDIFKHKVLTTLVFDPKNEDVVC